MCERGNDSWTTLQSRHFFMMDAVWRTNCLSSNPDSCQSQTSQSQRISFFHQFIWNLNWYFFLIKKKSFKNSEWSKYMYVVLYGILFIFFCDFCGIFKTTPHTGSIYKKYLVQSFNVFWWFWNIFLFRICKKSNFNKKKKIENVSGIQGYC